MRTLQLASFLACSWFWCIGGFFPILLLQDFGDISFPVFLIFNCLGATLFAFVWKNTARKRFLETFRRSAAGYSGLIVGYHVVFIGWISLPLNNALPLVGFTAVTLAFYAMRTRLISLSLGVIAVSAGLFAFIASTPIDPIQAPVPNPFIHQVLPLAFGFLLAPYFDLTFHRTFAQSTRPRLAFLFGFGAIFPALLCGVYLAAPAYAGLSTAGGLAHPGVAALAMLLVLQTGFTTAAHLRELEAFAWLGAGNLKIGTLAVASLCLVHLLTALAFPDWTQVVGELVYRNFVFVIGVIFPVILLFGGVNQLTLKVIAFVTPCYALGFLVGGVFAPFLSIALAGVAVFYWRRPRTDSAPLPMRSLARDEV